MAIEIDIKPLEMLLDRSDDLHIENLGLLEKPKYVLESDLKLDSWRAGGH